MSTLNDEYLKRLARELRLRSVSESDINQEILRVMESDDAGVNLRNEFGPPNEYAEALYPNRPKKQFYLFTAIGIALAVIGFVTLHVLFKGDEASSAVSLVKFIPLICMPIGIAIDVKSFSKV